MIDLHTHSIVSDGAHTLDELREKARQAGLSAFAVTDHDVLPENLGSAPFGLQDGLEVIPGIELAVNYVDYRDMHMIGLWIDQAPAAFYERLVQVRIWREERNDKILAKLAGQGMPLTREEILPYCKGELMARPHIAKAMVARGYCKNEREAFRKWLGSGCPAYAERKRITAAEGIRWIHESGGVAVWAHPLTRDITNAKFERCVQGLKELGLDAVEAYYPDYTPVKVREVLETVKKEGMLASGGTDFHGGGSHAGIYLGKGYVHHEGTPFCVPDSCLEALKEKREYWRNRKPYLFLDRDDTLIWDVPYLSDPDKVKLSPDAGPALRMMMQRGWRLALITNQSGIGRGYFTWNQLNEVHARLTELLAAEGVELDGIFICPHAPTEECDCRKPKTGMLEQAVAHLPVDRKHSVMVGDKPADIEMGRAFGLRTVQVRLPGKETPDLGADLLCETLMGLEALK